MTDVFKTILSGLLLFILSQYTLEFIFKPIKKFKGTIGEIDNKIKYYSNVLLNTGIKDEVINEISRDLRRLSCDLESEYKQIPIKWLFSGFDLIPCKNQISEVAKELIRLSNLGGQNNFVSDCEKSINIIREKLNIPLL